MKWKDVFCFCQVSESSEKEAAVTIKIDCRVEIRILPILILLCKRGQVFSCVLIDM